MQAGFSSLLPLAVGQRYRVNSFDLGFINILPEDLEIGIEAIDVVNNEIALVPLPISGQQPGESLLLIYRWFRKEYPEKSCQTCVLKNMVAFQRLVDCGAAVRLEGGFWVGALNIFRSPRCIQICLVFCAASWGVIRMCL